MKVMFRLKRALVAVCVALSAGSIALVDPVHAAPAAPANQPVYTVRAGDSIYGIAVRLGVSAKSLMSANNLTLNSLIYPGMTLVVPAGGIVPASAPSASSNSTYVVQAGDYLMGIAVKLKVSLNSLLTVNKLTTSSLIYPGMRLTVPAGGQAPAAGAAPAPSSSGAAPQVYVVVAGDSLSGIANRARVRLSDLLSVNQLTVNSVIHPGTRLTLPAGAVAPATAATTTNTAGPTSARLSAVLDYALAQQGKPYKFNTAGPEAFDCSGLTMAAYAQIGISLPHYSGAQVAYGHSVDWTTSPIKPGDLVFLESYVGSGVINHVGIATSATQWVQAPRTGESVRVGAIPMYRVVAVRRLVEG